MGKKRWAAMVGGAAGAYGLYWFFQQREAERQAAAPLPGDEIIPEPTDRTEYTIMIQAPPTAIWPWLVQMGYHRAGWYIDTWWDAWINRNVWPRLVPPEARAEYRPSPHHLLPEFQELAVGDIVPDGPPDSAYFTVEALAPERHLVLYSTTHAKYIVPAPLHGTPLAADGVFTWVFVLDPVDDHTTRLTLRLRSRFGPQLLRLIVLPLVVVADIAHSRQMLLGIKRRVEAQRTELAH